MRTTTGWLVITISAGILWSAGCDDGTGEPALDVDVVEVDGSAADSSAETAETVDQAADVPLSCGERDEAACEVESSCTWRVASCHENVLAAACFDSGMSPMPPPCAPLPCGDYTTEVECSAEEACNWWPEVCDGTTLEQRCRNVALGSPSGC